MAEMRTEPALLTVATCNRRAAVAVLEENFRRHHPGARIYICLVDRPPSGMPPLDLKGQIFFADELALPGGRRFLFQYDAFELCCALKPFALRHVLEKIGVGRIAYLDSDILVTGPFWQDLEQTWENHAVLLTPHLTRLPIHLAPEAQRAIMQHGSYNGGFIALRAGTDARSFLDWWARAVEQFCTIDTMNNVYVDQRWLDLAAASPMVAVLRDPGLNVAYWNLGERKLGEAGPERWTCDEKPLKFFHFSGFDREHLSSKAPCTDPAALRLAALYGQQLEAWGEKQFGAFPYGWSRYVDGQAIPNSHRDLFLIDHPELRDVADPFLLPSMEREWTLVCELARVTEPARATARFNDGMAALSLVRQLYHHPVIGLVWKLWRRFFNRSLGSGLPPYTLG
jgi:hypothetical protein